MPGEGGYSSLDEGGLDPHKYFRGMAGILTGGVNRNILRENQEELGQLLPSDHLL